MLDISPNSSYRLTLFTQSTHIAQPYHHDLVNRCWRGCSDFAPYFVDGSYKLSASSVYAQKNPFASAFSSRLPEVFVLAYSLKADEAFGRENGCLPMETKLPYKWPFALDILKRQYDVLASQRLLKFQSRYFDEFGPNMRIMLFGHVGYVTADPKNIESILSTRFEGWLASW